MSRHPLYRIPPTRTLVTFESAARHRSFSQAARELGIFQSAVSRQISTLEQWTSTRLFERSPTGVSLTQAGRKLHEAIGSGLAAIHRAIAEAADVSGDDLVVLACTHETSQFILLPRYMALCEALGEQVRVRILTHDQAINHLPSEPAADVVFTWTDACAPSQFSVPVLREAVRPVCSPAYAELHAEVLNGPVADWGALTLIHYTRPNDGWATWDDWFAAAERPNRAPRYLGIESYSYVLETAVAGRGIALGWQCFIERHLEAGSLVALGDGFVEFDNHCVGVLTEEGRGNPLAHKCLEFFKHLNIEE